MDRLTSATGSTTTQSFTFDANGNRLTQGGTSSSTFTPSLTSNRLTAASGAVNKTYVYDDAGHTTGDGLITYTYNDLGRMTSATKSGITTTYTYNALGQRVTKTTSGITTYFVYDEAGHLLGEYDNTGMIIQETAWMYDTPVASIRFGSCGLAVFYIHTDHLNTPRRITKRSNNQVVWRWDSDAYGTTPANENPSGIGTFAFNLRFPGQYFDSETGNHYNYYRDYDPAIGRYTQSDPIGLRGGINTYSYVKSNPVSFVDPRGLESGSYYTNPQYRMGLPNTDGLSGYYGGEFYFFTGGGLTSVTCEDECGKKKTLRFVKVCPLGAAVGGSGGVGLVSGMKGKSCNADSYKGWFFETGVSIGPVSFGGDVGYANDGSLSGVNEGSVGFGFGAKFKATWCYYIPID